MYVRLFDSIAAWYRQWYPPGPYVHAAAAITMTVLLVLNAGSIANLMKLGGTNAGLAYLGGRIEWIAPWVSLALIGHAALAFDRNRKRIAYDSPKGLWNPVRRPAVLYITITGFIWIATWAALLVRA
jgi:hypothetical protein